MATTVSSTGDLSVAFAAAGIDFVYARDDTNSFFAEAFGIFQSEFADLALAGTSTNATAVLSSGATVTLTGTNIGGSGHDWGITSVTVTDRGELFKLTGSIPFDGSMFTGHESLTHIEVATNLGKHELVGSGLDIADPATGLTFSAGTITTDRISVGIISLTMSGSVDANTGVGSFTTLTLGHGANSVTATGAYEAAVVYDAIADVAYVGWLFQDSAAGSLLFGGNDVLNVSGATSWFGFAGNDTITGDAGSNTLDGGSGADTMIGGGGDDVFVVDNVGDVVVGGDGAETVKSSISFILTGQLDNLTLTGNASMDGTGSSASNTLVGNAGDNTLDGGEGRDVLIGGGGNDTFIVDTANDLVTGGSGIDTVHAGVTYTLGSALENLVLIGNAVNGTGNAADNTITGNAADNTINGGAGADTMIGGGGTDTYVVDQADDVVIGGEGVDTARSTVNFTLGLSVENLILNGSDNLRGNGNSLENTISGNIGNNTLAGGAASDTYVIDPGGGNDVITDTAGVLDTIKFGASIEPSLARYERSSAGAGDDLIISFGTTDRVTVTGFFANTENQIERIVFSDASGTVHDISYIIANIVSAIASDASDVLTGTGGKDHISGLGGNDTLIGLAGSDTLDGGTGADKLIGNDGDDVYYVDDAKDLVAENIAEGIDDVLATVTFVLAANVENLSLLGSAGIAGTGNNLDNIIIGNNGKNALSGLDGADTLDGGLEADTLKGGQGDDLYIVDNVRDKISETTQVGSGIDTIKSSVSYKIITGVESLILTGTGDIDGSGGSADDRLTGNLGNNTLNGFQGADTMVGGGGNDTFLVDNVGDVVSGGDGTDNVFSAVGYTLGAELENLTLTGSALNGDGNGMDNIIVGNSRANILHGLSGADSLIGGNGNDTLDGGAGVDYMDGGSGNDLYILDDAGDIVMDTMGTDTIQTDHFSVDLAPGLEILLMKGVADLDGWGNGLNNVLTGNDGSNLLDGRGGNDTLSGSLGDDTLVGGPGADKLTGGGGADVFIFRSAADGKDTVTDFSVAEGDILDLRSLLSGWGGDIHDYLQVSQQGANTVIKVDVDGSVGGLHFIQIATVNASSLGLADEASLTLPGGSILV